MRKNTYITTQGDTWDAISLAIYGTETLMHILIEANHKHRNISIFSANTQLIIPEIPRGEKISFPPWRAD